MNHGIFLKLFKPSTCSFYQEGKKLKHYSFLDWLHGYVYSRWPYFYIGVGTGEHRLTRLIVPLWRMIERILHSNRPAGTPNQKVNFADTYHGKVIPVEEARRLVTLNKTIDLGDLEQVIPYSLARDIVLQNPDHIVALECPCRASRAHPCLPMDVCLIIGEPFASFIIEHHPRRSRWLTRQEAEEILEAEHTRGHVHHAFFKDAMLGRFYAICNCCSCCCGAMQAYRNGIPMLAPSGFMIQIDRNLCKNCGNCVNFCQFNALRLENDKLIVNESKCMGCGACIPQCEQGAHSLILDSKKGIPLEIYKLIDKKNNEEQFSN